MRFWNATPVAADLGLDLVLGGNADGRIISSADPGNFYSNYVPLPPGHTALHVFRRGDRQNALKSFDLQLRDRSYYTLLATQITGEPISVELIDDTPDPAKAPVNRVTVRPLCPDLTGVVTATGNIRSDRLVYGKPQTLEGLSGGLAVLHLQATKTGSTAVRIWDSEADFRLSHHGTMFISYDVYGRLQAHLVMDGPSPAEEAEAAEEAKSTP